MKSAKFPAAFKTCRECFLPKLPATPKNCNFWLFVAKKRKACFRLNSDLRNMVTGNGLATGHVDPMMPLTVDSNTIRIAGHQFGLPFRVIARLCGMIESRVPIGYEDEGGFHYGVNLADWFFSI
ncbi:MAG: hypothetical protein WAO21_03425 [Verrucomicrobiia bacterium]